VRAARRTSPGTIEVVDVDQPVPGADEVLVELRYAAVNPFDGQVLRGEIGGDPSRVLTLGAEATGYVDGAAVQVSGGGLGAGRDGTFAPYVVAPAAAVRALPADADLAVAATVGVAGRTAWRAVHQLAAVGPDDTVLVLGAAGGVGTFAVQLARATGARVLAHTGNETKAAYLTGLGAEPVVAATASALATGVPDNEVSVVLDPLGGSYVADLLSHLAPRARVVTYGVLAGADGRWNLQTLYGRGITVLGTSGGTTPPDESAASLRGVLDAVLAGQLVVDHEAVPLEDAAVAFDRLAERSVTGKLLLRL
jgi:NADPH2:quinone reductase